MRGLFRLLLFALLIAIAAAAQLPTGGIYAAIRSNDLPALQTLLSDPSNANMADSRGRTPLMHAAAVGTLPAMKMVIGAGGKVTAADRFGVTPLMFAIRDQAKVRLLLDAGADPKAKTMQGQTALLMAASTAGSIDILQLLVSKGADLKVIGNANRTGLIVAADASDTEMVRFFLDNKVDVDATDRTDKSGHTALMAAAGQSNGPMVRLLLNHGAKPDLTTSQSAVVSNGPLGLDGQTALTIAAAYGAPELIRLLLDAHAAVNARDVRGMTPLMLAVASENQNPDVIKMLLSAGADAAAKTVAGETALGWARKYNNAAILKLLSFDGPLNSPQAKQSAAAPAPSNSELRSMLGTTATLLQKTSVDFSAKGGCVSCHHDHAVATAIAVMRQKDIRIDQAAAAEQRQRIVTQLQGGQSSFAQRIDRPGGLDGVLYGLSALFAAGYAADEMTDAMVVYLFSRQLADGHWPREEVSRSPIADGDFNRVGMAVHAIAAFAPPALKDETQQRLGRAHQWLLKAEPRTTDDYSMLLIGLRRSNASESEVKAAGQKLLSLQRADGGWGGNPNLQSDAYATSEALNALYDSGVVGARHKAYELGVGFLLQTRQSDGSWHVLSRAPKFQPYFESGFPYGHDQWISVAGTARAAITLSRYLQ